MSNEVITIVLTIISGFFAWTLTVIAVTVWINGKLSAHQLLVHVENAKTREMLNKVLNQHAGRIMRLELQLNGSTLADSGPDHRDHSDPH